MKKIIDKRIVLITIVLSLTGIIPKFLKNSVSDWKLLSVYFSYIALSFLSYYMFNTFLWRYAPQLSYFRKFAAGLVCGFLLLIFMHLLLFHIQPEWGIYFFNLKEANFYNTIFITAFRAFVIQNIAFACLFFLKNKDEKIIFQQEIGHLNQHLTNLQKNQIHKKEYKTTLIVRFQDKVLR